MFRITHEWQRLSVPDYFSREIFVDASEIFITLNLFLSLNAGRFQLEFPNGVAGGGMLATDAALLAGGATFATGALMVANSSSWRTEPTKERGGEPSGERTTNTQNEAAAKKRSIE